MYHCGIVKSCTYPSFSHSVRNCCVSLLRWLVGNDRRHIPPDDIERNPPALHHLHTLGHPLGMPSTRVCTRSAGCVIPYQLGRESGASRYANTPRSFDVFSLHLLLTGSLTSTVGKLGRRRLGRIAVVGPEWLDLQIDGAQFESRPTNIRGDGQNLSEFVWL